MIGVGTLAAVFGLVAAELLAYVLVPRLLALASVLPLPGLDRRVAIPEGFWAPPEDGPATYRSASERRIAWARVPLPAAVDDGELLGWRSDDRRALYLRLRMQGRKSLAVAAVRLVQDRTALRIQARFLPSPITVLALWPVVFAARMQAALWYGCLVALVLTAVVTLLAGKRMRDALAPLVDTLERDIARVAEG